MNRAFVIGFLGIFLSLGGWAADSSKVPIKPEPKNLRSLTYANIVSYFKAAHMRATEVQPRCTVFFEGEWRTANVYSYSLIVIENSDEDIQATFYLTDAHEMNWITEFLDSPFFTSNETKRLFETLYSGRESRDQRIGRFRVDFHHWQPRHADIFVFSFTPGR